MAHVSSLSQESWQVDCSGQALTGYPVSYLNALSFICHLHREEQRELVPIWWAGSYWHIISFSNTWTQYSPKATVGLLKSLLFFCIHACVKTRTCPSSCMPLKSPIHRSKILPPFRTRWFFCFVKPHSISHCIIVGLYLCRVSAVFSSFRLYVISVLLPCFCLCWRQGQWGLWLLSPNICFWASCKRENLFVFNLRMREKDMKLPFTAAWGGGEVCDLLNKLIFVKTDSATKQNLPKQPEIPAFPINCLMLNVDVRWGICWMWHRNPKV